MLAECGGKMGQPLPGECFTLGEADDYAIIVSLSEKSILGKVHNFIVLASRVVVCSVQAKLLVYTTQFKHR